MKIFWIISLCYCFSIPSFSNSRSSEINRRKANHGFKEEIKDFNSDGCSSFPNGYIHTQEKEWLDCCIIHDIDYWMGGERKSRRVADDKLRNCVANNSSIILGIAMGYAVRAGGSPSPLPWRWGYGWDMGVGYRKNARQQLLSIASKFSSIISFVEENIYQLNLNQAQNLISMLRLKLIYLYSYLGEDETIRIQKYQHHFERIKTIEEEAKAYLKPIRRKKSVVQKEEHLSHLLELQLFR